MSNLAHKLEDPAIPETETPKQKIEIKELDQRELDKPCFEVLKRKAETMRALIPNENSSDLLEELGNLETEIEELTSKVDPYEVTDRKNRLVLALYEKLNDLHIKIIRLQQTPQQAKETKEISSELHLVDSRKPYEDSESYTKNKGPVWKFARWALEDSWPAQKFFGWLYKKPGEKTTQQSSIIPESSTIEPPKSPLPEVKKVQDRKETNHKLTSNHESISNPEANRINQDFYVNNSKDQIFGVFDGVSQSKEAAMASRFVATYIENHLKKGISMLDSIEKAKELMHEAINQAHKKLKITFPGSETTGTVSFIFRGHLITGQIGDSRCYLFRKNKLKKITQDDSKIPPKVIDFFDTVTDIDKDFREFAKSSKYSEQELNFFWQNSAKIEQAFGSEKHFKNPTITATKLESGDRLLYSSDGVHDNLTNTELERHMQIGSSAKQIAEAAHVFSLGNGDRPKKDDTTAVVVEFK